MKQNTLMLLSISEQQLQFQARLTGIYSCLRDLSESHSIDALATAPMLDQELHRLSEFNKRISQRIQRASR